MTREQLVIERYEFYPPEGTVDMRDGAQVLSVQAEENYIVLWVLCAPYGPTCLRRFGGLRAHIAEMVHVTAFIGTVTVQDVVWHVFEVAL